MIGDKETQLGFIVTNSNPFFRCQCKWVCAIIVVCIWIYVIWTSRILLINFTQMNVLAATFPHIFTIQSDRKRMWRAYLWIVKKRPNMAHVNAVKIQVNKIMLQTTHTCVWISMWCFVGCKQHKPTLFFKDQNYELEP